MDRDYVMYVDEGGEWKINACHLSMMPVAFLGLPLHAYEYEDKLPRRSCGIVPGAQRDVSGVVLYVPR